MPRSREKEKKGDHQKDGVEMDTHRIRTQHVPNPNFTTLETCPASSISHNISFFTHKPARDAVNKSVADDEFMLMLDHLGKIKDSYTASHFLTKHNSYISNHLSEINKKLPAYTLEREQNDAARAGLAQLIRFEGSRAVVKKLNEAFDEHAYQYSTMQLS